MGNRIIFIFLLLVVVACGRKTPDGIPEPDEMSELIADLHIADATFSNVDSINKGNIFDFYQSIFKKHHITKEEFDKALLWYAQNPEQYTQVYDASIGIISQRVSQLAKVDSTLSSTSVVNRWSLRSDYKLPCDSFSKSLPFTIDIDKKKLTKIELSADFKYLKEDRSGSARIILNAKYKGGYKESGEEYFVKTFTERNNKVTLTLKKDSDVVEVSGYLIKVESDFPPVVNISDIQLLLTP